ncbi:MAG TPA: hypothetical protein VK610_05650, partial [Rhodothermales bacterium]|nr:hypothetical protein [Rhodothermales bacterium]
GGLLYLGVAGVVDRLVVGAKALRVLARSGVVAAWALLVVVPGGALAGERGLVLGESVVGTLVALGFVVMGGAITVFVVTLTVGAWAALRAPE